MAGSWYVRAGRSVAPRKGRRTAASSSAVSGDRGRGCGSIAMPDDCSARARLAILAATRAAGGPVLARAGANEPIRIMQALDLGAAGVVVPQIRTADDVRRAVDWCRYPPVGMRGVAPRRASEYGRHTSDYLATANATVTCCIQIETAEALTDVEKLLAVPGIDALLIGPNDLAASIGRLGQPGDPKVEAAIGRVLECARAAGVPAGVWTASPQSARTRRDQGFAFATVGTDYGFMLAAAEAPIQAVRRD